MLKLLQENAGWVALLIIAILALTGAFWAHSSEKGLGTACTGITCLAGGLRLTSELGGAFESDVAAVFASTITQSTTNTATTSARLGCIQTTATSTATPIKLIPGPLNTTATSTVGGTIATSATGFLTWAFGTCP